MRRCLGFTEGHDQTFNSPAPCGRAVNRSQNGLIYQSFSKYHIFNSTPEGVEWKGDIIGVIWSVVVPEKVQNKWELLKVQAHQATKM